MRQFLYIVGLACALVGASFLVPRPAAAVDCNPATGGGFAIAETNATTPELNGCIIENFVPTFQAGHTSLILEMNEPNPTNPDLPVSDTLTLIDNSPSCALFTLHCTQITFSSDLGETVPEVGSAHNPLADQALAENATTGSTTFVISGTCYISNSPGSTPCTPSIVGLSDINAAVPEPSTGLLLLGSALPALGMWRLRRPA